MSKPVRFRPIETPSGWMVSIPPRYSESGARERHFYRTKKLALEATADAKKKVEEFGTQARVISPSLAEQATAAEALLKPHGLGLLEAVTRLVKTLEHDKSSLTVVEVVKTFRANGKGKWSHRQEQAYRFCGEKLIKAFGERKISTIVGKELESHLEQTCGGPTTYNHTLGLVKAIWNWSSKQPRNWTTTDAITCLEPKSIAGSEIGVLNPEQVQQLMSTAEKHYPDCVPPFAISLFTGMRQAELERLHPRGFAGVAGCLSGLSPRRDRSRRGSLVTGTGPNACGYSRRPLLRCVRIWALHVGHRPGGSLTLSSHR